MKHSVRPQVASNVRRIDLPSQWADPAALQSAHSTFETLAAKTHLHSVSIPIGKSAFKECGMSPDGAAQALIQLGFAKCHRDEPVPPVYEACSTSYFYGGRTETIRSNSPESSSFVRLALDPSVPIEKVSTFISSSHHSIRLSPHR